MSESVRLQGITKRFGSVVALESVDLTAQAGSLHAIVGENGAGKTTLMRILYGAERPDAGTLTLDGVRRSFTSSEDAIRVGVGMVSQHYGVIPQLTVLQNLLLGAEGGPWLGLRAARRKAAELAQRLEFNFDWDREASELTPGGRQRLEILRLLWRDSRVLILDEPTAMLSPDDSASIFRVLERLAAEGRTVLIVTHRLPEVFDYCRSVTVLREGRTVAEREVSGLTPAELAGLIVGREEMPRVVEALSPGNPILDVRMLSSKGLHGANFIVREREILGVAGVDGNGQRELIRTLFGIQKSESGRLILDGAEMADATPRERMVMGVRVIPEDRHEEGLIESLSIEENAALGLQRFPGFARRSRIYRKGRQAAAVRIARRFGTRYANLTEPVSVLSGGNQQRLVAGRAMDIQPRLLLAFQPARGLDIASTAAVYRGIREECSRGMGALVVSFDLDELLAHCDRIIVMQRGQVKYPPKGQELDREAIGKLMVVAG